MMELQQILDKLKDSKSLLQSRYSVRELAVFGSYARNEQKNESDIDILVTIDRPIGVKFVDLALELENILQHKVDLVSRGGIQPKYFAAIEKELHYA